ncbi:MAG: hypothetical protein RL497_679 [Pseudomonadota bacterium]|jgi:glycosyltransferase involved in cell wall biosynthesis
MHWLIDAGAIKTGGGVQVALNRLPIFVQTLTERGYKVSVLLPSEGLLAQISLGASIQILRSPKNWAARLFLEHYRLPKWMEKQKIDIIYTLFGFGLPHPKQIVSVVSTANPTTCYPDSIYWKRLSLRDRIKRSIYTNIRQARLKKSDFCIFETEVMRNRSIEHIGINRNQTAAINPSPTGFIQDRPARTYADTSKFNITLLTGIERHKNIDCVIKICKKLSDMNIENIQFNISLTKSQTESALIDNIKLDEIKNINYLGKIPQNELQPIYDNSDVIMNLSELESFSNNYMEAWKSGLAQICSDRDFSRHICKNSALYIEPLNTEDAAEKIVGAINNSNQLAEMAEQGKILLNNLLSHHEYVFKTIQIIDNILKIQTDTQPTSAIQPIKTGHVDLTPNSF